MVKCLSEESHVFYILVVFLYYIVFNVLWRYKLKCSMPALQMCIYYQMKGNWFLVGILLCILSRACGC